MYLSRERKRKLKRIKIQIRLKESDPQYTKYTREKIEKMNMAEETKKGLLERGNEISVKRFDMAYNKVI